MSVASTTRLALAALFTTQITDVQVSAFPLAEDTATKEAIHLGNTRSTFEWRSIGRAAKNRTEDLEIDIHVHVFREGPRSPDAAAAAIARCEALLASIETAIVTDAGGAFTVGGTISQARISEWDIRPVPRDTGWSCQATARLTGRSYP